MSWLVARDLARNGSRRGTKFDEMPIRVGHIDLVGGVGTCASGSIFDSLGAKVIFPLIQVIDQQSVVIAPRMGMHRGVTITDQMEFLILSETKPCARKRESRAWDPLEPENFFVKATASRHVLDMQGDVVQLLKFHGVTP